MTRSRVRKDVILRWLTRISCIFILHKNTIHNLFCLQARYGSLKIKGKKRPPLSSANYGMWPVTDTYTHTFFQTHILTEKCANWMGCQHLLQLWIFIMINTSSLMIFVLYFYYDTIRTSVWLYLISTMHLDSTPCIFVLFYIGLWYYFLIWHYLYWIP